MPTQNKILLLCLIAGFLFSGVLFGQNEKTVLTENEFTASQALFTAGSDAMICNDNEFITQGRNNSCAISMWQSSGDGFFENSNDPITIYTPGTQDIINGNVTLSLVLIPLGGGGNDLIYDEMNLHINHCFTGNGF